MHRQSHSIERIEPNRAEPGKGNKGGAATLQRTTFMISRLLEFFTEKELQLQIGHAANRWPLAILKELIDNALDACEAAGVQPEIAVAITADALTVTDNGPGIPPETIARSLDYTVRVSDKSYYASPTRGQLGNALKCVWAAPFVVSGETAQVEVVARGLHHQITVRLDRIAQQPVIDRTTNPADDVKTGTVITIHWPGIA